MGQAEEPARSEAGTSNPDSFAGPEAELQRLMEETRQALRDSAERSPRRPSLRPFPVPDLGRPSLVEPVETTSSARDSDLPLRMEWGRRSLPRFEPEQWSVGDVVPMDQEAGEPVDIYAEGQLVARGEVLVLEETICVRITELLHPAAVTARRAG